MTELLEDLLARIVDDVVPAPVDPSLWSRARRSRRRERSALAIGAVVLAGAGIVVGSLLSVSHQTHPGGTGPAKGGRHGQAQDTGGMQLTYAVGDTVHYGDRVFHHSADISELDLTDDGVAFRDTTGGLYFLGKDGYANRIGTVRLPARPSYSDWVASSLSASVLVWPAPDRTVVLYDTATSQVRARIPLSNPSSVTVNRVEVKPAAVYWAELNDVGNDTGFVAYDRASETSTGLSERDFGRLRHGFGPPSWWFHVQSGVLRSLTDGGMGWSPTSQTFRLPGHDGQWISTANWLDKDRVVAFTTTPNHARRDGDLFVCTVSTQRCIVVGTVPKRRVLPVNQDQFPFN